MCLSCRSSVGLTTHQISNASVNQNRAHVQMKVVMGKLTVILLNEIGKKHTLVSLSFASRRPSLEQCTNWLLRRPANLTSRYGRPTLFQGSAHAGGLVSEVVSQGRAGVPFVNEQLVALVGQRLHERFHLCARSVEHAGYLWVEGCVVLLNVYNKVEEISAVFAQSKKKRRYSKPGPLRQYVLVET